MNRTQDSPFDTVMTGAAWQQGAAVWRQLHTPVAMAQDLQALLAEMHEEVIQPGAGRPQKR